MRNTLKYCGIPLAVLLIWTTVAPAAHDGLGKLSFPNSGSEFAQEAFLRGVLLLHSFEYEDSREAFQEAQDVDPEFAMAYWGEAMTHNHPLWRQVDREAALEALSGFAATPEERRARLTDDRERRYFQAIETLYGAGDKIARDFAYSDAMEEIVAYYPTDLEARTFLALSILGTAQGQRDFSVYMRAGAVAEEVFAVNPMHPGAAHYMIHSYDDPVHAPLGLRPARVYARIAPAASHAQHMISHIYVALGRWNDSVGANVKSFDVSVERRERKVLPVDALNYHSLHWLEYSYLQLGRFEDARTLLEMMAGYVEESGSPRAQWYYAAMRAAWIAETGGADAPDEMLTEETQITGAAADLFAAGYAALLAGDLDAAAEAAIHISSRNDVASHGPLCEQTSAFMSTSKKDLVVADVLKNSLRALIEWKLGRTEAALELLEAATAAEEAMPMDFGPPIIVKPSHELYGELLLQIERPAEAQIQFRKALERAPRRSLSLAGLASAARAAGDQATVVYACAELSTIYARADEGVTVPEACK